MKTIKTLSGERRIDTENMLIETASGGMIEYKEVIVKNIDDKQCFALMVDEARGVAVEASVWREFVNAGKETDPNWNQEAFVNVMSEGYGDY